MQIIRLISAIALCGASTYATCERASKSPDSSPSPVQTVDTNPDVPPDPKVDCPIACQQWRRLSCPEGQPSQGGISCEAACLLAGDAGIDTAIQLSCAANAHSCADLRACPY